MSDHQHESYEVYGLDGTRQDAREALALAGGLREDLAAAEARISELEDRVKSLEGQTPDAIRLQNEADVAAADLAASGYDKHGTGCGCGYCYVPGDGESGAS